MDDNGIKRLLYLKWGLKMLEINKIICGEASEVMKTFPDNCIDLTVTSPPYDNLRSYNGYTFDFEAIAQQLYRVTKKGGVVVWVVGDQTINGSETGTSFRQALYFMTLSFNLHDTMIWNKGMFTSPQTVRYPNVFEYMFIFSKGKIMCNQIKDRLNKKAGSKSIHTMRKKNGAIKQMYADNRQIKINKMGVRFNIWNIYPEQSNHNRKHPAQFSEQLANDHIISWSNKGDLILDPMCGSGTVPKMAIENDRNYIGIEISEKYIPIIENRIKNAQPQLF